jgi:TRAP transporter TAXI family solute receptor
MTLNNRQREIRLDELLAECMRRADADPAFDRAAYLREQGNDADELQDILNTADLVDCMAGPKLDALEFDPDATVKTEQGSPDETTPHHMPFHGEQPTGSTISTDFELGSSDAEDRATIEFGDYELLEVIGRGGMGVVYKARETRLDRLVAVKMILGGRFASDGDIDRFYTEAKAAAKLEHRGVVRIYNVGEHEGHHYFTMDLIEGTDLATLVDGSPLAPEQAAQYLRSIAEAVHFAHEKGILHRDLKPGNVLIDEHNQPLITDFGLAKYLDEHEGITGSGAMVGTPSYMSPEQAAGRHEDVGRTADVYALGAILYAMLTGWPPFRGRSTVDILLKVIHQEPVPPGEFNSRAKCDLETICMKCLHKEPQQRYQSAEELAEELQRFLRGEPIKAKPIGPVERTWRFVQGIPIVAAATGSRIIEPSAAQRRVQRTMMAAIFLVPILSFVMFVAWRASLNVLPRNIRIATGTKQGRYYSFGVKLAEALRAATDREATPLMTTGSGDNRKMLLSRQADLALLQASAIRSDGIAVVAPVYYEVVHVLAKKESGIQRIEDMVGRSVAFGHRDSGMWTSATILLDHYSIKLSDVNVAEMSLDELARQESGPDAAILTIGLGADAVGSLVAFDGQYELLPIEDAQSLALEHPVFRPFVIQRDYYPDAEVREENGELVGPKRVDIQTIATMAFLAARHDAPDVLIMSALNAMYSLETFRSSHTQKLGFIPRARNAEWQGLAYHPAARRYFEKIAAEN